MRSPRANETKAREIVDSYGVPEATFAENARLEAAIARALDAAAVERDQAKTIAERDAEIAATRRQYNDQLDRSARADAETTRIRYESDAAVAERDRLAPHPMRSPLDERGCCALCGGSTVDPRHVESDRTDFWQARLLERIKERDQTIAGLAGDVSDLRAMVVAKDAQLQQLSLLDAERLGQISFLRERVTVLALTPPAAQRELEDHELSATRQSLARMTARLAYTVGALHDLVNVADGIARCSDDIDDEERAELLHVVQAAKQELSLSPKDLRERAEAERAVVEAARVLDAELDRICEREEVLFLGDEAPDRVYAARVALGVALAAAIRAGDGA